MSGPISISGAAQWQSLLSGTNVVVADFYADWCGPCKTIAPHFERLAKDLSSPGKAAFAKVNVDTQQGIARTHNVTAMPTFIIFHGGQPIKTLKGADPRALSQAVTDALKLGPAPGKAGAGFKTPGRTLGGQGVNAGPRQGLRRPIMWDINKIIKAIVIFIGLYVTSLFSFDPYMAAKNSQFNVVSPPPVVPRSGRRRSGIVRCCCKTVSATCLQDFGRSGRRGMRR